MRSENGKRWVSRLAYGSGDAACNVAVGMMSSILILFYTDYIGIDPVAVGLLTLISRFVDGGATLVIGWLCEKTPTRFGRFRPWILLSALPYAVSLVLLFTVPMAEQTAQLVYIFAVYNLCTSVLYNTINIPYGGLLYAMTRDPQERDMLSTVRMCLASIGRLLAVCGTMPLVRLWGGGQSGWAWAAVLWAVLAVALLVFCGLRCVELPAPAPEQKTKPSFAFTVRALVSNRYFWMGGAFQMLQSVYYITTGTGLTYYSKYILGNDGLYSILYLVETVVLVGVMLLCPPLIRRWGKRRTAMLGLVLAAAGQLVVLAAPQSVLCVAAGVVLRTVGYAPFNSAVFAFIGEAVEYGHWKNHLRQDGLVCSGCAVVTKVGSGLATAGVTGLLSLAGYVSTTAETAVMQPAGVLDMIAAIYTWGPVLCIVLSFAVLAAYTLEKKLPQILQELEARI